MQMSCWKKIGMCGVLLVSLFAISAPADAQWTFIRGDSNGDGNLDIADAIFSLNFLFSAGPGPCLDAIDANDDGMNDIADPIFALDVLFGGGGTTPAMPFPMCGEDPTADALDCAGPLNGCPAVPAGCNTNADCAAGEFCETAPGMCGTVGTCAPIPFICSLIFDPVCGCDGMDYSNACNAAAAGTSVDTAGNCPVAGCTTNADCAAGEFCETAPGMCGTTGACAPIPFICSLIFDPVCGCDGMDYSNACNAAAAGTSVDTAGMCPVGGCTTNADCAAGEFCETAPGMCGTTGACAPIPFICSLIFDPVCGCDGMDYSNACNAASAGTSVDTAGMCVVGGCLVNADCPAGEFCETAPGMCGTTGACAVIPFICTFIFDPVCGCDGMDYSNPCVAASNGVSVDTMGMCP